MTSVFIKVPVSERLPDKSKWNEEYFIVGWSDNAKFHYQGFVHEGKFIQTLKGGNEGHETINRPYPVQPKWWLEERTLPTEEEIAKVACNSTETLLEAHEYRRGCDFILNHIKKGG